MTGTRRGCILRTTDNYTEGKQSDENDQEFHEQPFFVITNEFNYELSFRTCVLLDQ